MKLGRQEKFAFITLGVATLNAALMAHGVETMPGMWIKEVYQDHMLGASLGFITGVSLGGVTGAGYLVAEEVGKSVVKGITSLREKFNNSTPSTPSDPKPTI